MFSLIAPFGGFSLRSFVTLDKAASYHGISKLTLQKLKSSDKRLGRTDRFTCDGLVLLDFSNPLYEKTTYYYYKALTVAGNERTLARAIAINLGKSEHTIYSLFRRFRFKNQSMAKELIVALQSYINSASLFDVKDL